MDDPVPPLARSPARLSKTPSWVSLGFIIGVLFMWALPRDVLREKTPPLKPRTVILDRPKSTDIEAVFATWGEHAIWENDLTQVALWDVEKRSYSQYYEILRNGDVFYFRSIPKLTRPILTHGISVRNCPLVFTETEAMRREWLEQRAHPDLKPDYRELTTSGDGK